MKPYLSVVIPCFNEETNIRLGSLDKVTRFLERQQFTWEVLVVDDGSSDQSPRLLDGFARANTGFTILHNAHLGKAGTVIAGMLHAKGDIVLFSDLDQATPMTELPKLLPFFAKGFDVVIGSRDRERLGAPFSRVIMARGFMLLRSLILGLKGITDTQCGFKAFRREVSIKIFQKLALYDTTSKVDGPMVTAGFDIEVLFLAKKFGYSIKEVPVEWHYVETRRVNPIKDSIRGLIDIIHIRINAFRGRYT